MHDIWRVVRHIYELLPEKFFLKLGNFNPPLWPLKNEPYFSEFWLFEPKFADFTVKLPNFTKISFFRGAYMFSLSPLNLIMMRWRFIFLCKFKNLSRKLHFSDWAFLAWFCTSAISSQNLNFPKIFAECSGFFLRCRYWQTATAWCSDII